MAKLQSFKRINVEDFASKDQDMVSKISYSVNTFAEDVLNALTNQISITDNLNIVMKNFIVKVNALGQVIGNATLKTGLDHPCQGILVIKAVNTTVSSNLPSNTPFLNFTENSGLITIKNVTGLTASNNYSLTLILF